MATARVRARAFSVELSDMSGPLNLALTFFHQAASFQPLLKNGCHYIFFILNIFFQIKQIMECTDIETHNFRLVLLSFYKVHSTF